MKNMLKRKQSALNLFKKQKKSEPDEPISLYKYTLLTILRKGYINGTKPVPPLTQNRQQVGCIAAINSFGKQISSNSYAMLSDDILFNKNLAQFTANILGTVFNWD